MNARDVLARRFEGLGQTPWLSKEGEQNPDDPDRKLDDAQASLPSHEVQDPEGDEGNTEGEPKKAYPSGSHDDRSVPRAAGMNAIDPLEAPAPPERNQDRDDAEGDQGSAEGRVDAENEPGNSDGDQDDPADQPRARVIGGSHGGSLRGGQE
jgi:hypothetical protein